MSDDRGELAEVRRDLREMRFYIEDASLREDVAEWITASYDRTDADTAEEFLERELNGLLADNEMYHDPRLSRGEEGFPDDCRDCKHYGSACPVLLDNSEVRWRERQLAEASSEQEARRVYQQQAIDVSCKAIPAFLKEWDSEHSDFVKRGQNLLEQVEEALYTDEGAQDASADLEPDAVLADGGDDDT